MTGYHAWMELRRLRYFVAMATELHFGRAATRLGIAQPALSQQIRKLEAELSVRLLERSSGNRAVALTEPGRVLLGEATELLERAARAAALTKAAAQQPGGRLRVSYTRSAPNEPARSIVAEFRRRYPSVEVLLTLGYTGLHIEQLRSGQLDAAFVRPPLDEPDLDLLVVGADPLVVALPAGHRLARRRRVRPAELAGEPVVSWPRRNAPGLHDLIRDAVWGWDAQREVVCEEPDDEQVLRAVAAGAGVAVLPSARLATLKVPSVVIRRFADPAPTTALAVAWRRADAAAALACFLEVAHSYTSTSVPAGTAAASRPTSGATSPARRIRIDRGVVRA
jgi:DNA-binding transcriptional LysR family regulator